MRRDRSLGTVSCVETGTPTARLTQWFRGVNPWVLDACVGTLFTAGGLVALFATSSRTIDYHDADAIGVLLVLACSLPYYFRRRAPFTVFAVSFVVLCLYAILGYPANVESQFLLVGTYSLGAHAAGRARLVGLVMIVVGLATVAALGIPDASTSGLVQTGIVYLAAYLFGSTMRNRRLYLAELEARAADLERERDEEAKRAVADERLRIAQELHDVVAHSMGVIAVQAGVGAHVIDTDPAEAKHSLEAISATSRSTLGEIRRILGVLRGDGAAALQPAPGLADLPKLAADFGEAGLPVTVTVDESTDCVPAGVDLTAFRIVQEALTNTLKYAGPARAEVTVSHQPGVVAVSVTDDGRGVNGATGDGGHGLLGMRERVGVYGGTLHAGPRPGGGFRVIAALPYGECE